MSRESAEDDDFYGTDKLSIEFSNIKKEEYKQRQLTLPANEVSGDHVDEKFHKTQYGTIRYDTENESEPFQGLDKLPEGQRCSSKDEFQVHFPGTSHSVTRRRVNKLMESLESAEPGFADPSQYSHTATEKEDGIGGNEYLEKHLFGTHQKEEKIETNVEIEKKQEQQLDVLNYIDQQYFSFDRKSGEVEPVPKAPEIGQFPLTKWERSQTSAESETKNFQDPLSVGLHSLSQQRQENFALRKQAASKGAGKDVKISKRESKSKGRPANISQVMRQVSRGVQKSLLDPDSDVASDTIGTVGGDTEDSKEPKSAFDTVQDIRRKQTELEMAEISKKDRDGSLTSLYQIWSLIPDVYNISSNDLIEILRQRILFSGEDLLCINKPYGLSSQGGPKVRNSLSSLLTGVLRSVFPSDWREKKLYLCQRLDKETTGAMILATTWERKEDIASFMLEKKVVKKYLCITKGIPDSERGTIRIPLGERLVGGRYKMIPCPEKSAADNAYLSRDGRKRTTAETEYRVLSTAAKCALVECTMRSGVKHQIRSHLGFGLNCPVLGDHKYSDFLSFKPQRVPGEVLHCLGIRSQKSRDLPMYLHALEIMIPEFLNGRNFFVRASLPQFFVYTMKKLKLAIR